MAEKKSEKALEPFHKEENWLAISITLAIIAAVLGGFGLLWILDLGPIEKIDDRIKVATLVGTGLLALITYSTVVWRGLVGARQANEQKRANDAKDQENTAQLLLDGAKLLSDAKNAHVAAGIAALELVVRSHHASLGLTAMNILADFIIKNIDKATRWHLTNAARVAMHVGSKLYRSKRSLVVVNPENDHVNQIFHGFQHVTYINGAFGIDDIYARQAAGRASFKSATIIGGRQLKKINNFSGCIFFHVKFELLTTEDIVKNKFIHCSLTGTKLRGRSFSRIEAFSANTDIISRNLQDCVYAEDNPPTGMEEEFIIPLLNKIPVEDSST